MAQKIRKQSEKLDTYNKKRNFAATREPEGRPAKRNAKLRFSVQRHAARSEHFDLRLEHDGVALSWAVPKGPSLRPQDKRLAMRVEDHPVDYMDFEGTIPKGQYGGGTVMLWDEGEWEPRLDPEKGLRDGSLKFRLFGKRLKGDWALVRMKNGEKGDPWLLIKENDEFALPEAAPIYAQGDKGVRSGKTMDEIAGDALVNPFASVEVMLPLRCETLPRGKDWVYELKYDGYRTVGFIQGGEVVLKTRNGKDCTETFRPVADALKATFGTRAAVVDGETVVAVDGVSDFSQLKASLGRGDKSGLQYMIFDLLALDGEDMRGKPLLERKARLNELLRAAPPALKYSGHVETLGDGELKALAARKIEGVVAKRADSTYSHGKNGDWQKLKFRGDDEFVIGGYTAGDDGEVRSLLVGYYDGDVLKFAGKVGTGLTERDRRELGSELSRLVSDKSPFADRKTCRGAVWVLPKLAAQTEYAEFTASGLLRQASFKGLRRDKAAGDIAAPNEKNLPVVEKTDGTTLGVKITHPDKVMFADAGATKGDLAHYYALVCRRMLPYVQGRTLSIVCCPSGVGGEKFFRKHLSAEAEGVTVMSGGEFFISDERGLVSLAQNNAVEFHPRASRAGGLPDVMVFDLDPDEGLPLSEVRRGARDVKAALSELGLRSFVKTSGGKGYHIVVPLSGADEKVFRDFAKGVAEMLEARFPDRYTSSMSKRARTGKIFVDWQRNSPEATSVAPYSVRARAGATVSCPIFWNELDEIAPDSVTLASIAERLDKADPWRDFFTVAQSQSLEGPRGQKDRN